MRKPKPIKIRVTGGWGNLRVVGYKSKARPYLHIDIGHDGSAAPFRFGYIEDRDVRRLKNWCEDCLKKRK